jgi:cell filamentation protein
MGGELRTVRISKNGSAFLLSKMSIAKCDDCSQNSPNKITMPGLEAEAFAKKAAHFLAELNAIHPFREGNGRTQLSFLTLLAEHAGHSLNLEKLDPTAILEATIESFGGSEKRLAAVLKDLISV